VLNLSNLCVCDYALRHVFPVRDRGSADGLGGVLDLEEVLVGGEHGDRAVVEGYPGRFST
jgi:hypothetical protein